MLAIVARILVARHLNTADDLFGGPQGSPRTDKLITASMQWAERIMRKIGSSFRTSPAVLVWTFPRTHPLCPSNAERH